MFFTLPMIGIANRQLIVSGDMSVSVIAIPSAMHCLRVRQQPAQRTASLGE